MWSTSILVEPISGARPSCTTMKHRVLSLPRIAIVAALSLWGGHARAERPMVVDDAGTLARGGAKVEFGLSRDGQARGLEAAVGYGPIDHVEVELGVGRSRDRSASPTLRARSLGAALKWVPLQAEHGLSAGLKLQAAHDDVRHGDDVRTHALDLLATWSFDAGPRLHANLGRESVDTGRGDERATRWGLGLDVPLGAPVQLTLETFGARHARPDRQVGLRWELAEGLKLSGAVGRGNGRPVANLGLAWEF